MVKKARSHQSVSFFCHFFFFFFFFFFFGGGGVMPLEAIREYGFTWYIVRNILVFRPKANDQPKGLLVCVAA